MRITAAAISTSLLAGCAIAVPLRPFTALCQKLRYVSKDDRVAYHHSQPVRRDKIDDPPDFMRD